MKTALVALKDVEPYLQLKGDWFGADRGSYLLAENNVHMKCAIGDFDSVSDEEFSKIQKYSDEVIRLNPVKDDSDCEHVVTEAIRRGYDKVVICSPFGGRLDHSYVNLKLAIKYPGIVKLIDQQNVIYALSSGVYEIEKNGYTYISFFTEDKATISLEGFAYSLEEREITYRDIYTVSNEILLKKGKLTIHKGVVLVMQCKDMK